MKRKLLSLVVASLVCGSVAEAKFYLGFDIGYTGAVSYNRDLGMYFTDVKTQDLQTIFKHMFKTFSASNGNDSIKVDLLWGLI